MGILGKIFGGKEIAKPIEAVGSILDNLFTSKDELLTHQAIMQRIALKPTMVQTEINKIEASHRSVFVAGWRPFIGWVCGVSLFCYYVPQYLMASYVWSLACLEGEKIVSYPINADGLTQLVLAMLGMAGIRSFDKLKGKSK